MAAAEKAARVSQPRDCKLIVEKDVQIPLRDGTILYADVFRPDFTEAVPAIMNISVYQKDKVWIPPADLEEKANPYMNWETTNPEWWCPRGYACVRVDSRGTGKSPGRAEPSSYQESLDFYDAIEWIAKRDWCSGSIGTLGISYHASSQWRVANLKPPSLKAIIPWEGRADQYRDQVYHGGIFSMGFVANWIATHTAHHLLGRPRSYNPDAFQPDFLYQLMQHDLDSEWWRQCSARWENIDVPLYTVGNWGGFSLHLRGNTEGFMNAASKHKKLRIHTGTHFHPFHSEEGRMDQLRFLDHWLKGIDTGIMDEPPVKLCVRTSVRECSWRFENEWPLARTQYERYYLTADNARVVADAEHDLRLADQPPRRMQAIEYDAGPESFRRGARDIPTLTFVTEPMAADVEITGHINLVMWVSSATEDMDVFAYLRNMAPDGSVETATRGILKVSHRKLDPALSTPYRPYHTHDEEQLLDPGEIVPIEVEIWATSMVFQRGHRIRLDVQPHDGEHYFSSYKRGTNTVYVGGDRASYVLLPIIPAQAVDSRTTRN
jgi:predicted acyl esterase